MYDRVEPSVLKLVQEIMLLICPGDEMTMTQLIVFDERDDEMGCDIWSIWIWP